MLKQYDSTKNGWGQFTPKTWGQFAPEYWGQFHAENRGLFGRNFHTVLITIRMSINSTTVDSVTVEGSFTALLLSNGIVEIHWHPELEQLEVTHLTKIREILFQFGKGK